MTRSLYKRSKSEQREKSLSYQQNSNQHHSDGTHPWKTLQHFSFVSHYDELSEDK